MPIRGIRGATTVSADEPELILEATREVLEAILDANESMKPEDVASALFTVTEDLSATFPAQAARQMGWGLVPMMCAREIPVPGALAGLLLAGGLTGKGKGPDCDYDFCGRADTP